jgi:YHS domain-containing protein
MRASLSCPVHPERPARFENELRSFVNWEAYFFSDAAAKTSFDVEPWRWCGRVTDPVTRARFVPTETSPRAAHGGRPYFFQSDSTRTVFLADAERYAKPKTMAQMKPMDDARRQEGAPDAAVRSEASKDVKR